ncbi:MAG TPA: site-2 protease family protein [Methanocorpusculum sp.]|nr:site-2 protease family protein [Methanocorpusculum sp.]
MITFDWRIPVIIAVMLYACLYYWLKSNKILPHLFDFTGPCIMIKTEHVGIFDTLSRPKHFLKAYATTGIILTVISGIVVTIIFVVTAYLTVRVKPEPTAVQNLLLIPGINDFIPSTVAVWVSLIFAMVIHEFGHGILSRVEGIKVKSTGILTLLIPIGAFVEPNDEDVNGAKLGSKLRMFAAGITNNIVFGIFCLVILSCLIGMVVPGGHVCVVGVNENSPVVSSGLPEGFVIFDVNGVPVSTQEDLLRCLSETTAGDVVSLNGEYRGVQQHYDILLSAKPSGRNITDNCRHLGISFIDSNHLLLFLERLTHPDSISGFVSSSLIFVTLPFTTMTGSTAFSFLVSDVPDSAILKEPFLGFWGLVHLLFWSAWINILLGMFNAVPIRAFDGGQMLREFLGTLFKKRGKREETANYICSAISYVLIMLILLSILLPYLFR